MIFSYKCPTGHIVSESFSVGQAHATVQCPSHHAIASRHFGIEDLPFYQEDRSRFFRNSNPGAPTENWSYSLGCPMPESRRDRKAIEKMKGIEMVSPSEARQDPKIRKSLDYLQHIREGGDRNAAEFQDAPKKMEKGWLAKALAEKGVRFVDRTTDSGGWNNAPHTEAGVAAKMADRGWSEPTAVTAAVTAAA